MYNEDVNSICQLHKPEMRGDDMPRPTKERNICCMPKSSTFGPVNHSCSEKEFICMTIDEYECIRLIDLLGCNQEECAKRMSIARSTVQMIYNEARKKMADSLVNGKLLHIKGGSFRLCDGNGCCPAGECRRRKNCPQNLQEQENRTAKE